MNKQKTTIYIVRHGESIANANYAKGVKTGTDNFGASQSPLTNQGKQQAAKVAEQFRDIPFAAIFSSDLRRAKETAESIAKYHDLPVLTQDTIRERFWGSESHLMDKTKRAEIEKALEALSDQEKLQYRYFPDGETAMEAVSRFTTFLKKVVPEYKGKTILVVNHGNMMRSFLIYIGYAKYHELPNGTLDNCGYIVLEADEETYLVKKTVGIHKREVKGNEE